MLVCAAGPLDTGQFLTYLYILLLPVIVLNLIYLAYPTKIVAKVITKLAPWRLRGRPRAICRTRVKRYKIPERKLQKKRKTQLSNHADLPLPGALHHLQSWLSSGGVSRTVLQSTLLPPSLPKQADTPTNIPVGPI